MMVSDAIKLLTDKLVEHGDGPFKLHNLADCASFISAQVEEGDTTLSVIALNRAELREHYNDDEPESTPEIKRNSQPEEKAVE